MANVERRSVRSGFWITSLGILASRVLGLVRDMATAALLGLGEGGVMDALILAFRIPNTFRRLFGEGALTACYLPVFAQRLAEDKAAAWRLASVLFALLAATLSGLVLVGEGVCAAGWHGFAADDRQRLLIGLMGAMLPYLLFICLAAQISATLQALSEFRAPAFAPALLNICWLIGAWWIAPCATDDKATQAYIIAGCVVVSGVLQAAVQLPALLRLGFRFQFDWPASRESILRITRAMGPLVLGLMVTQINTLLDSVLAWILVAPPGESRAIPWLGGLLDYPLESGAVAAIYFGERLYQFPVGLLGVAMSTVIFPLLSRHAAAGDRRLLADDLVLGVRLTVFTALPASVGLVLLAEPLARLLLEHGEFTAADATRAARTIACYAVGVWAYCAGPVVVRGFYAVEDRLTPVRLALVAVGLNVALNLILVWPMAEAGLAISTAIAAAVQVGLLVRAFSKKHAALPWAPLGRGLLKTGVATLVMAAGAAAALRLCSPGASRWNDLLGVSAAVTAGLVSFLITARLLGSQELKMLVGKQP